MPRRPTPLQNQKSLLKQARTTLKQTIAVFDATSDPKTRASLLLLIARLETRIGRLAQRVEKLKAEEAAKPKPTITPAILEVDHSGSRPIAIYTTPLVVLKLEIAHSTGLTITKAEAWEATHVRAESLYESLSKRQREPDDPPISWSECPHGNSPLLGCTLCDPDIFGGLAPTKPTADPAIEPATKIATETSPSPPQALQRSPEQPELRLERRDIPPTDIPFAPRSRPPAQSIPQSWITEREQEWLRHSREGSHPVNPDLIKKYQR